MALIRALSGSGGGGSEYQKVAVGDEGLIGVAAYSTGLISNNASITSTAGNYYTNKYDVSDVSSAKLMYNFNAGSFSYAQIGYEIDGTFTRLEPTTTVTTITINLSGASKLSFRGNIWSNSSEGGRIMGGYIKFS